MPWNLVPALRRARRPVISLPPLATVIRVEELESRLAPSASVPVGGNIDGINYWSLQNVFVDTMKQATLYSLNRSTPGNYVAPTTDANGWPTEDFMAVVGSGGANTAHIYNGIYKVSLTGQATITATGGTVSNLLYNAATNTTTADVTLNASESSSWNFVINFSNTNGQAKNVQVMRPGYLPGTSQVFSTQFQNQIQQFQTIRFMDFEQTNNNQVVNWSDRAQVTDAVQSSSKGVAWEYVIQLANTTNKDVWINIPVNATDDYVKQLATLIKAQLNPNLHVYVEYSNELWNGAFSQTQVNLNAAIAEVNAGGNLKLPGDTQANNQWDWAARRVAERSVQISNIFASVFGQSAMNNTVRVVLPGQFANLYWTQTGLNYIEANYGSPSNYLYGIASAPYFYVTNDTAGLTETQIMAQLQASAQQDEASFSQWTGLATYYNLKAVAYEGGPDTSGANNIAAKAAAQSDPAMETLVSQFMTSWYAAGGSLFNWYYAGAGSWTSQYGAWAMTNDPTNLNTPKYNGITDVQTAAAPAVTAGTALPGNVSAVNYIGSYSTSQPYLRWPYNGETLDYIVNAPTAGTYNLAINYAANQANGQVQVLLNDSAVQTLTLATTGSSTDSQGAPNAFADSQSVALNLNAGLNVVRLKIVNSGYTLNALKFTTGSTTTNQPPTVAQPATASSSTVNGTTVNLSVLGADNAGESSLIYTWAVGGPAAVTFSANGTNAAKNTTATFTAVGTYNFTVTIRDAGGLTTTSSVTVNVASLSSSSGGSGGTGGTTTGSTPINYASGMSSTGMQSNGISAIGPGFLQLTDGSKTVAGSSFFTTPVNVAAFSTQFTVQESWVYGGNGFTFTIQNNSATALGSTGTGLGYQGIGKSVALAFNLQDASGNAASLLNLMVNGVQQGSSINLASSGINLGGSNPLQVKAVYDGSNLTVTVTDTVTGKTATSQFAVNIGTAVGGSTAYAGFTAGSSATASAVQQITNWTYTVNTPTTVNQAPTFAQAATASSSTVTGTTVNLSALGADDGGEANLIYTWSVSGPAAVSFSANGTNAAKNSTATFTQAGTYTFTVTAKDAAGLTATSTVAVTVNQTATTVSVTPNTASVTQGKTQQFTANVTDQFGKSMTTQPALNWSVSSTGVGGTISSTGLYTAPLTGTPTDTVRATLATTTLTAAALTTTSTTTTATTTAPTSGAATVSVMAATTGGTSTINYATGMSSTGMQMNGNAAMGPGFLQLTDGSKSVASSAFYNTLVNTATFSTQFTVQESWVYGGNGFTFTIQNSSPTALGSTGTGLGYLGIAKSVALTFNLTDASGNTAGAVGLMVNGVAQGSASLANSGISLSGTNALKIGANYDGTTLTVTITDTVTGRTSTAKFAVNIGAAVGGSSAYVGFTAGSSSTASAVQQILNWTYTSAAPPANAAPTIAQAATASANPVVNSNTTNLSVLGADDGGEANLTYTWAVSGPAAVTFSANGTNAAKNTTATFTKTGTYTFTVTIKDAGGLTTTSSVAVTVNSLAPVGPNYANGITATGMKTNGNSAIGPGFLQITDGSKNVAGSAWYTTPLNVTSFSTQFTFQESWAQGSGFTFALQNSGTTALGSTGSGLGYVGIPNSVAVDFRLQDANGKSVSQLGLMVNGVQTGTMVNLASYGIDLHSSDTFKVGITYDGTTLSVTITDTTTGKAVTQTYAVNIAAIVGSTTAYAGFTGGSSTSGSAVQRIYNWTWN